MNGPRIAASKVVPLSGLADAISALRAPIEAGGRSCSVVTTNGCFDIIHAGHISLLERARTLGDLLVVGVNSDASVRALKGEGRPLITDRERALVVAAMECVDVVTIFEDQLPLEFVRVAAPTIHVKGGDYSESEMPEAPLVRSLGGRVEILSLQSDECGVRSSSAIAREAARRSPMPAADLAGPGEPGEV